MMYEKNHSSNIVVHNIFNIFHAALLRQQTADPFAYIYGAKITNP